MHTGLLAARHVLGADLAIVTQGPGNLGTGTRWGFSGVAAGEAVNAVAALGGRPVGALRISDADPRPAAPRGVAPQPDRVRAGRPGAGGPGRAVGSAGGPRRWSYTGSWRPLCPPHRMVEVPAAGSGAGAACRSR